jgi:hypothetical protein
MQEMCMARMIATPAPGVITVQHGVVGIPVIPAVHSGDSENMARHLLQEKLLGENSTVPGSLDAIQLHHGAHMPQPFLFVAVLTTTSTLARRQAHVMCSGL